MQVAFALYELQTEGQYAGLWKYLKMTEDIYSATDKVCRLYEQPYYCNVDARFNYAMALGQEIGVAAASPAPPVEEEVAEKEKPADASFWPPRMIDKSMTGADITVLQAILTARGYYTGPLDGLFGDALDEAVRRFQREHDLDPDGVVGPLTWHKLLEME